MREREDGSYIHPEALSAEHQDLEGKPVMSNVMEQLRGAFPDIAEGLITTSHDMSNPANQSFALDPDSPSEHAPKWHQYGILTHSYKFADALQTTVPAYAERWGLKEPVEAALSVEIDGISKSQLLQAAALVHDVGKFTARQVAYDAKTDTKATGFRGHEEDSGKIIRNELKPLLKQWGLSDSHIEYIAVCAELHFELGKVRRAVVAVDEYTIAFVQSPAFAAAAKEVIDAYPDYALEIGLQFIGDSLSKTEFAATSETDAEIILERPALETEISAKDLDPQLINQALQQPINIKATERYLRLWAGQAPSWGALPDGYNGYHLSHSTASSL